MNTMNLLSRRWLFALAAGVTALAAHAQAAPYGVLTHYDAIPESTAALAALRSYVAGSSSEPGATSVQVQADAGRPSRLVVVEVWASQAAYETHLNATAHRALQTAIAPWLVAPPDRRTHTLFE